MELQDYIIQRYYSGSSRLYNWKLNLNRKMVKRIQRLKQVVSGDISKIVIESDKCYFELIDGRKYIFKDENSLDMLILYNINQECDELLKKIILPGSKIIEVGACWGYCTVYLSKLAGASGCIYAFEPQSKAFDLLMQNIIINQCENVLFQKTALTNMNGTIELYESSDRLFFTSISSNFDDCNDKELCEARRLDDCISERFDILKVDIEGAECLFLEGAMNYISRYSPLIIMEVFRIGLLANRNTGRDIIESLPQYQPFIANNGTLVPVQSLDQLECEDVYFLSDEHKIKYSSLLG